MSVPGTGSEIMDRNGILGLLLSKWGLAGGAFAVITFFCYLMLTFIMGGQSAKVQSIETNTTKMLELQAWQNKLTTDLLDEMKAQGKERKESDEGLRRELRRH